MSKMIMISREQSVKASRGSYTFMSSQIGVPATVVSDDSNRDGFYKVKGIDIVLAYQLIAEPLPKLDALHCERDGAWHFHPSEVILVCE